MKKFLFRIDRARLAGRPAVTGRRSACGREKACSDCGDCCPHCGCRLVRVCHTYCTTKTVIEYKYTCVCEDKCVPGLTPLCDRCGSCDNCCEERLGVAGFTTYTSW